MSADYLFSENERFTDDGQFTGSGRFAKGGRDAEVKKASSKTDRILKKVLMVLAVLLFVELVWLFGITPCMPFSHIDIRGIDDITDEAVIAAAGLSYQSSFINTNSRKIQKALESLYMVGSANVKKRFPDSLLIEMSPRIPVTFFFTHIGSRLTPVFLDREGVIFNIGASRDEFKALAYRLPVISGLVFENPQLGARLPEMLKPFLADLERINAYNPDLLLGISEIRIHKKIYDGFELVLYPMHSPVRFRMGAGLNEEILRYMMLVIDVLNERGVVTEEEIDFRTGTASYRMKLQKANEDIRFGEILNQALEYKEVTPG